jgi:hypothetical protein
LLSRACACCASVPCDVAWCLPPGCRYRGRKSPPRRWGRWVESRPLGGGLPLSGREEQSAGDWVPASLELVAQVGGARGDLALAGVSQEPELKLRHAEAPVTINNHASEPFTLCCNTTRMRGMDVACPGGPPRAMRPPVCCLGGACSHAAKAAAPHRSLPVPEMRDLCAVAGAAARLGVAGRAGVLLQ